jgi:hypothetical protein
MAYTPPIGNSVDFDLTGAYTPPSGNNVNLLLGDDTVTLIIIWTNE